MNPKSWNFKIYLGVAYIIVLSLGLYFLFTTFDLSNLTSYDFIRENRDLILRYKENNILINGKVDQFNHYGMIFLQ